MPDAALRLEQVSAGYGQTVVLEQITLSLAPGEAVSILGRNGVGKSTLLATIMGHTTLHHGAIWLGGDEVTHCTTYQRVWRGLGFVPQERDIFSSLTVQEHLAVATRPGDWTPLRIFELFPNLAERRRHLGRQLSGGEQQMLAIGRALVGNPSVLLMDEPSEGLAPVIVDGLQAVLTRLRDEASMAMVLVEQNSHLALDFAERCVVMNRGQIIHDGPSQALRGNRELLDRLIGVDTG
jgi:branched-chain amino acid transport system ATP-binding protein